jgi:putative spermidine/putrescine transport system ATP-binding protein
MSQGLMEQVGTPANIYNFPSSEFVAQFVGQLNMIPVTQVDLKENSCLLAGQKIKFEHSPDRKISDSPKLAIRPEELQIGTGDGRNALKGRVESVLFLGAIVRLHVDVGGVSLSADFFNERTRTLPRVGDDVIVSFPEYSCWLV